MRFINLIVLKNYRIHAIFYVCISYVSSLQVKQIPLAAGFIPLKVILAESSIAEILDWQGM
ncbi:hypothetical protein AAHH67_13135 [Niallia circulans]